MVSFPPELFGAILAEVDSPSDLLQLRSTNSTLNSLATPLAFRSIRFANRDKSIARFKRLTTYPKIAELIREVVYQYEEADPSEPLREYTLRGFDGTAFVEVLGLISQLPGLESLVLNFRAHDGPFRFDTDTNDNDREFPAEIILQFLIFRALAENSQRYPSPLKSLTIDKLLPLPHPYISSPTIIALLSTLSHLSIKTTTQCAAFPMTDPRLEWTSTPLFEKGAFSTSLASLELHHASVRSADVLVSLSEIQLPRLETLSLQRIYFSDKGKPEDFIARHGGTLLKLKLFLCPMALSTSGSKGSEGRPASFRRWTQVWERLRSDLKNLRGLVVSERHDSNGVDDAGLGRYVDNCYSCNAVDLGEAETAEDDIAFELFQKSVVLRSHDV